MKFKVGSWGEFDFDKDDAKIAVPLILLAPALAFTQIRKEWLLGGAAAYYFLYFFLPPCFAAIQKLLNKIHHWRTFRCPYCKSHELIMQGMQEFHGDIPYDWYFCHKCRMTSVYINTLGAEKMLAPNMEGYKELEKAKRELADS
jgi:hypothetical protein